MASPSFRAFYGYPIEATAKSMDLHGLFIHINKTQSILEVVMWDISVATSRLVQPQRELVRQLPDSHEYRLSGAPIGPLALQMRECDLLWPGSPIKFLSTVWFYCFSTLV